jgi:enoyl-CoA hydratase
VVAEDAKLRLPELGLGTFVGGGTVYTLAHRVGVAKAKELIMLGEFFSGRDAVEMGLANTAVPVNEVWDESLTLARKLAGQAPIPMRLAKELIHRAQRLSYEEALDEEAKALLRCMETRDWKEGIAAFQEKRAPHFTGE